MRLRPLTDQRVERLARDMCLALGKDPDALRPATGYENALLIPTWFIEKEWAVRALVAQQFFETEEFETENPT